MASRGRSLATLLAFAAAWAATPAAAAAPIGVSTTVDELDATPDATCSLREAVRSANLDTAVGGCAAGSGTDTITMPAGTYSFGNFLLEGSGEDAALKGDLDLTTPITIQGAGQGTGGGDTVVDWTCACPISGPDRVFHVLGAPVTLSNMRVRDGAVLGAGDGGGVLVGGGGSLAMTAVTIATSHAGSYGGGLAVVNGTATIAGGSITANGADNGGGIAVGKPGTDPALSTLALDGTSIVDNDADDGGGIQNQGSLTATGITVAGNGDNSGSMSIRQTELGGGIYNAGRLLAVTDSTIGPLNEATGEGGGLYNPGGSLTEVVLRRVRVTENEADDPSLSGASSGGGIHSNGPPLRLIESTIDKNKADGPGGGIYDFSPGSPFGFHTLDIERSTLGPGNRASNGDGLAAVSLGAVEGQVTVTGSTFSGNNAFATGGRGGGLYARGRPVAVRDVTFIDNAAGASTDGGNVFAEASASVSFRNTLVAFSAAGLACATATGGTLTSLGGNQEYTSGQQFACGFSAPGDFTRATLLSPTELRSTLADDGGPTQTHALFAGAPPVDGGAGCVSPDQRGITRPQHGVCDAGAFELDTAPDTAITSGPSGTIADVRGTFGFSADEPGASFECAIDGAILAACQSPFTTPSLTNGAHTFRVRATDAEGGIDPSPATRAFTVTVPLPGGPGPGGGGVEAFGSKTLVTIKLAGSRIPATGRFSVVVSNANAFRVAGVLSGETAKAVAAVRKRRVKLKAKSFSAAPNGKATLKLRLPNNLRRLLSRSGKLSLRLTAKVKDPAGTSRTVTKRVSPRRAKRR